MLADPLDTALARLADSDTSLGERAELIVQLLDKFAYMKKRIRELEAQFNPLLLGHLKEAGPLNIGEMQWYAGLERNTECLDVARTLEALFTYLGGDFDKVAEAFAARPFKYGYCKQALPPAVYASLFRVVEGDKIVVKQVNKAFVKSTAAQPQRETT